MSLTRITRGVIKPNENYDTHNINSTGIITAIGANFSGNVSVGGVLTYEDVTNIDSVGIITAQSDIHVGAGVSAVGVGTFGSLDIGGDIDVDGHTNLDNVNIAGIVTSNTLRLPDATSGSLGRLQLGNGLDLSLFHNGTNSFLINNTGYLSIQSQDGVNGIFIARNAEVNLYYGPSVRLQTSSSGVTINRDLDVDGHTNLDNVSIAGVTTTGQINANGSITATRLTVSSETPRIYLTDTNNNDDFQVRNENGTFEVRNDTDNHTPFSIASNNTVTVHNDLDVDGHTELDNVNIVGVTTHNGKTNLYGNGGASAVWGNTGYSGHLTFDGSDNAVIRAASGKALIFQTNHVNERLRITAAGEVLINESAARSYVDGAGNTQTPKLQVESDDNTSTAIALRYNSGGGSANRRSSFIFARTADGTAVPDNSVLGEVLFMGEGNNTLEKAASIRAEVDGTPGTNDMPGRLIFSTSADGSDSPTERVRITNSGNVGIASAIPSARLDVFATGGTIAQFGDPRSASFECIRIKNNVASYPAITNDSTHDTLDLRSMGSVQVTLDANNNDTGNYFRVMANGEGDAGTERFRVTEEGFVGINSTSPRSRLDIYGDINFQNNALISNFDVNGIGGSNVDHIWHSDASNYGSGGTWNFCSDTTYKATGNSTIQINYLANSGSGHLLGNVGIGLTNPATNLHVQKDSTVVRFESTNDATSARVEILGKSNSYSGLHFGDTSDHDNGFVRYYNADNYMLLGTNAIERVKIHSDGRVDIGGSNEVQLTSNNQAVLYLNGAIVGADIDLAYGARIIIDDDDTGTTTADRERGCIYAQFNGNATGGNTSDETRAWNIYSDLNINEDYDNAYGLYADVRTTHTSGTITTMRGVYGICQNTTAGTINEMIGVYGISQPTSGSSGNNVLDCVGGKFRANMTAGTSTAGVTDMCGVWSQIDNDNEGTQPTGGKCALFYGNYDKTTNLHNPQGIRIDTDVPNYFRGALCLGNGGNFLPADNNLLHLQDATNGKGILLKQTGNQYNVIKGDANRTNHSNAILDFTGAWNGTEVARVRIETGADTTNKDDGRIQFYTASGGTLNECMRIQENGEIAMDSAGSISDAQANLHVQNETFRVSNPSQTNSYCAITAYESGDDGDRAVIMNMSNNTPKFNVTRQGQIFGASHHYAGRARTDANVPVNHYAHGAFGFFAFSGRTDDTSAARTQIYMRAWDAGDHGDRSIIQYQDSGADGDTVNGTSDIRFVIKADGRVQGKGGHFYAGRVEHDNSSPSSYYQTGERGYIAYGNDATDQTYIMGRNVADSSFIFFSEVNDEANVEIEADGSARTDGTWSNTNADYAEMFEWADGNVSGEERRGMTVVLDGDKIKLATDSDNKDDIIGVVSANPVIVGDSASMGWHGRYKKDAFDAPVRKPQEFLVWYKEFHEENGVQVLSKQPDPSNPKTLAYCDRCPVEEIDERRERGEIPDFAIQNNIRYTTYAKEIDTEKYDRTKKYIPRQDRKEWDAIGLVGKLIVKRGQPIGSRWILMKSNFGTDPNDPSIVLDKYLVR